MADTEAYTTKPQRQGSQITPSPSKLYAHFLFKAALAIIFVVVILLFPSQAPEFINQTLYTRSWGLLQLIFVGIVVSYGLFSKRNDETDYGCSSKFDNAQSYVLRLLQVSSVFDDEAENQSIPDDKIQTWNSQYSRGEPVVVVAQETSAPDEQRGPSHNSEKSLLLPVRSLKSGVSDSDINESYVESSVRTTSLRRSSSKRFSSNSRKFRYREVGGFSPLDSEGRMEENAVLHSSIPWRSRSGRMEMKEERDDPLNSLLSSMEKPTFDQIQSLSSRSLPSRSSRNNSTSPSPNKHSPSPSLSSPKKHSPSSLSSESLVKNAEDLVTKNSNKKSPPPRVPPSQKQPPSHQKPSTGVTENQILAEKELKRSIRSVPKESNGHNRKELPSRTHSSSELKPRNRIDSSLKGKSVRTIRPGEPVGGAKKSAAEIGDYGTNGKADKEPTLSKEKGRTVRFTHESVPPVTKQSSRQFPKEEKKKSAKKVIVETDEDAESEDDCFNGNSGNAGVESDSVGDGGPDVDKKADEFIAKFREQIRLQRISSIRRSTEQLASKSA